MQELNLRSLPTAPYDVSNAILPPPSGVENVVAPTQATTPDSSWLSSREVLTPGTTRRCESIARQILLEPIIYEVVWSRVMEERIGISRLGFRPINSSTIPLISQPTELRVTSRLINLFAAKSCRVLE